MNPHLNDLQWIGASGSSPGRYERPQGITFDLEGRIIICDTKQKRIQILHPKASFQIDAINYASDLSIFEKRRFDWLRLPTD